MSGHHHFQASGGSSSHPSIFHVGDFPDFSAHILVRNHPSVWQNHKNVIMYVQDHHWISILNHHSIPGNSVIIHWNSRRSMKYPQSIEHPRGAMKNPIGIHQHPWKPHLNPLESPKIHENLLNNWSLKDSYLITYMGSYPQTALDLLPVVYFCKVENVF